MLIPSWGRPMTTDHCSKLFTFYLHICYKLGTFPSTKLLYDTL